MAFIPKAITSLITDDPVLSRVSQNVRQAVQPTLDFLNTYVGQSADGSLRLLRNTVAQGTMSVAGAFSALGTFTANGAVRLNGDVNGVGNFYFKSRSGDGFVISPSVAGAAFFVTNVGGTAAVFIVYDTGAVISAGVITAPSFVSNSGFKCVVNMGHYYHTAYPGGQVLTVETVVNRANSALNYKTFRYIAPRAGSVTAIGVDLEFTVNTPTDVGVLVNGNLVTYNRVIASNVAKGTNVFTKGSVPFNAGDTLTCYIGWGAVNINACAHVNFELELGA